jgi:hypothetical protein
MKRPLWIAAALSALGLVVWGFAQVAPSAPRELAGAVPVGPLLYLEAKDFRGLLNDWNASAEKRLWLTSANFQVFERSRLFLRLQQAQAEFAAAAGVPPDMALLENVAGDRSALALYDIGDLKFLFLTHLPANQFAAGALWKTRGAFQPRQAAGLNYYVRSDPASHRVAAFAAAKDYVLLATSEDAIAGALTLLAGQSTAALRQEPWFAASVQAAQSAGDLRMAVNFERVARSPYFRSYWIQRNVSDLKEYTAAISDLVRAPDEIVERRWLLRASPDDEATPNEAAVARLLRFTPADAGLVRSWASPTLDAALALLGKKILQPGPDSARSSRFAPQVNLGSGVTGSEDDLETQVDQPPLDTGAQPVLAALRGIAQNLQIQAMLSVQSTRARPDGVFTGIDSAVALEADADWNATGVRTALSDAVARTVTTGAAGAAWVSRQNYFELDGLAPLAIAVNGRTLFVSNSKGLLEAMLAAPRSTPSPAARYAAVYRHQRELPAFARITRLIDNAVTPEANPQEPPFFSGNLAGLGATLGRIESESIAVHDAGAVSSVVVRYKLR